MTCVGERKPRVRRMLALFFNFGFLANILPRHVSFWRYAVVRASHYSTIRPY